jgi:hypothetical protein
LVFAARSGKTVENISLVSLDMDGNLHPGTSTARGMTPGVKIVLSRGDGPTQTLYYFQTDLSDLGTAHSGFLKFAATLGPGHSIIKSASYLLHTTSFYRVRDFILANSLSVVQDDSGVPFAQFRPDTWNFFPFGNYLGPISIFGHRNQPKLGDLFRKARQPLEFGIGYRHRGHDSNLLLAVRKEPLRVNTPQATQVPLPAHDPLPPPTARDIATDKLRPSQTAD